MGTTTLLTPAVYDRLKKQIQWLIDNKPYRDVDMGKRGGYAEQYAIFSIKLVGDIRYLSKDREEEMLAFLERECTDKEYSTVLRRAVLKPRPVINPRLAEIEKELQEKRVKYQTASGAMQKILFNEAIVLKKEKTLILSKRIKKKVEERQMSLLS